MILREISERLIRTPLQVASPVRGGHCDQRIEIRGGHVSDSVDLSKLTAGELVAYGERAGWTTEEIREALAYRQMIQDLDNSSTSLRQTLNDPMVLEATRLCEAQMPTKEPKGWLSRFVSKLFHSS